jgi:hypothetical protein
MCAIQIWGFPSLGQRHLPRCEYINGEVTQFLGQRYQVRPIRAPQKKNSRESRSMKVNVNFPGTA